MPMKIDVLVIQRGDVPRDGDKRRAGCEPYTAICLTKFLGGLDSTAGWTREEAINKMRDQAREVLRHYKSYSVETVTV